MQFFAWLETHGFSRRDADLGSGTGVAAYAGLAGADAEHAKPAQLDALATRKGLFQTLEDRIHSRLGFGAGQPSALDYVMNDVLLNQSGYLASDKDCTMLYEIDGTEFVPFMKTKRDRCGDENGALAACTVPFWTTSRSAVVISRRVS